MTTPEIVPNGFQPKTDPMSLYSAATGISATCNGTTISPTIVRKSALRPRHLPNTMEYAVRLEIAVTRIVAGTLISMEVLSASSTAPGRQSRGDPSPQCCGRPPGEELLVVLERELRGGGEHFPPPRHLEEPSRWNEMIIMDRVGTSQNSAIAPSTMLTTRREGRRRFREG